MKRILIVDASTLIRERLRGACSELPGLCVVGEAQSASEAIQALAQLTPDAVILDISLEESATGLEVLDHAKNTRPTPLVIMFTNHSTAQYRRRCSTADYFFSKGTEYKDLLYLLTQLASEFTTQKLSE